MTQFKDLFSGHAGDYGRYRPRYPAELFDWLAASAPARDRAADVGCGNGQASIALAERFAAVDACDPSEAQIAQAPPHPKIAWRVSPAEATGLAVSSVDLLCAAQAFHWFRPEPFFAEARRVLRSGGLLAIWTYNVMTITPELDAAVLDLYREVLGAYWEPERRLVEDGYRGIAFPFARIAAPEFEMRHDWSLEQLLGYIGTWSALKTYQSKVGANALEAAEPQLRAAWGEAATRVVRWPLTLHAFRL